MRRPKESLTINQEEPHSLWAAAGQCASASRECWLNAGHACRCFWEEVWRAAHWRRDLVVSARCLASRTMGGAGWAEAVLDVGNCDGASSPTRALASDVEWHSTWGGVLDRRCSDQREPHGAVPG